MNSRFGGMPAAASSNIVETNCGMATMYRLRRIYLEKRGLPPALELEGLEQAWAGGSIEDIIGRIERHRGGRSDLCFTICRNQLAIGFFTLREGTQRPAWAPQNALTLHHLRIAPAWRRRGAGSRALALAAAWIRQNRPSIEVLALSVNVENLTAVAFYQRCGFQRLPVEVDGRLGKEVVMTRSLTKASG